MSFQNRMPPLLAALSFSLCLSLSLTATQAHAAALAPYQEAALQIMLSGVPAEQRTMVRPQLEGVVAKMSKQQLDMMLSSYNRDRGQAAPQMQAPAPQGAATPDGLGEWGKAEAEFDRVLPGAQAYMDRVSGQRDAMRKHWDGILSGLRTEWMRAAQSSFTEESAMETCEHELLAVPLGRRQLALYTGDPGGESFRQSDRIKLRQMLEFRARYASPEQFAHAVQQPVNSEMVQAVRFDFAPPGSEADASARLAAIDRDIAALLESSSRERHKIDLTGYADQGAAITSKQRARDTEALRERTRKAAQAICAPGREAYERALVGLIDPLVPKVKPYLR